MKITSQTQTLMNGTLTLTVSKVLTAAISMISAMLLSRFRTLEEYGTYSQLLLAINLFTAIFMLGLPNCLNFFLAQAENEAEQKRFLSVFYTLSTILSIMEGLALLFSIPLLCSYFKNVAIGKFWYFLLVFPWAYIIGSTIDNLLVVFNRIYSLVIYRLLYSLSCLGVIVLVQLAGWTFQIYMILYEILLAGFAWAVYYIAGRLVHGLEVVFDRKVIKRILKFSLPIGLSTIVGTLSVELDKLLIGYVMDTEQLAIYTNAARELPVTMVATSITAVLMPQLAKLIKKNRGEEAVRLWNNATELSLVLMTLLVAGVFTFAPDVMTFLYSQKYLPGVSVFRVYTLVLILRCTYFGMILNASGRTTFILWSSIISLVANAVLNVILFFMFGMIGPAIATFLSILLVQILQLKVSADCTNVPFSGIFPWRAAAQIMVYNLLLAVLFHSLKTMLPLDLFVGSFGESLILGIVWCAVYGVAMKNRIVILWKALNNVDLQ